MSKHCNACYFQERNQKFSGGRVQSMTGYFEAFLNSSLPIMFCRFTSGFITVGGGGLLVS